MATGASTRQPRHWSRAYWLGAAACAGWLSGCGPSESTATTSATVAAVNGINIDHAIEHEMAPDDERSPLLMTPAVQAAADLIKKGDADSLSFARTQLQAIVDETPNNTAAHYYLGKVLCELKQYPAAVKEFRIATGQRGDVAEILLDLATASFYAKKPEDAYVAAYTAAASDPGAPTVLKRAARIFYQCGKFDAAENALLTLVTITPDDPEAWHDRARNTFAMSKIALASDYFEKAIGLYAKIAAPTEAQTRTYAGVLTDYGIVAQWDHSDDKATIYFQKAVTIDRTNAMAWFKLSQERSKPQLKPLYNLAEAALNANEAVSLSDGKNPEFLHQLARVYALSGNLDRAVGVEEAAVRLDSAKYERSLQLLRELQTNRAKSFDPDQF